MTQPTGLQVVARARVSDPLSSVRAARYSTTSGTATSQAGWFLEAVKDRPGLTASELAALSDRFDRYQANRRLADLHRLGLVEKGESRTSDETGHLEVTWHPRRALTREPVPGSAGAKQEGMQL